MGGRGPEYAQEFAGGGNTSAVSNVTGLDQLAWGNIRPTQTHRYWAHLILAVVVIVWVCGVFFAELKVYIKVRQDYLTSAEHRLRASATTVLVSAIPQKWLTVEALEGLYDVFPGGIRNIWINRSFDVLLDKIKERDAIFKKLEGAETALIKAAKKAQRKQAEKEEKANAREVKAKSATKEEREQKRKAEDANAERLAQSGGVSTGDPRQVPHTVDEAIDQEEERARQDLDNEGRSKKPALVEGFAAVGAGLGKGFGAVGGTVFGGARNLGKDLNNQLETTNGFMSIDESAVADDDLYDHYGRYRSRETAAPAPYGPGADDKEANNMDDAESPASSADPRGAAPAYGVPGNTVRKNTSRHGLDGAVDVADDGKNWWKFWNAPSGGFTSPVPHGYEDSDEFPLTQNAGEKPFSKEKDEKPMGFTAKLRATIPLFHADDLAPPPEYPIAYNTDYKENATGATWEMYLKEKDRPTHRLPRFSWTPGFLPGLPGISKKVDTIYWCRGELARLNLEIEIDQKHPERFPLMNSAFIQFNHQVAAHMACQAVTHHVPKHMAPRTVEISPRDVLWDNMSIKWWEAWLRVGAVTAFVAGMVILWTFPVAFTASIAQITSLADKYTWLHWLNKIPKKVLQAIAGVLPALLLSILLALVPPILSYLAFLSGAQTGVQKERSVQNYYFSFLFVQVFLVVSISGGAVAAISSAANITSIPETLATQLPKAANYFFSYMILQALSTSSGTLLQLTTLIFWFILPKLFDSTAREKWTRNTTLPNVTWGTYFPVYTNFACIAIIYSVVSPLIIIFAIITFTLLWIANRYNMLYVSRFQMDTGGLVYPTAINQTFTGLYVMELCMVGLFFLVRDAAGNSACVPQAIIMIVLLFGTALYQVLLNLSFAPLFRHLPITFEDEAVLRDEVFERAQARRLGLVDDDEADELPLHDGPGIEMERLNKTRTRSKLAKFNPANMAQEAGSWALRSGRALRSKTTGRGEQPDDLDGAAQRVVRKRRHRDVEAQKKIADALYGGYNDEIEDLTPEERDVLVKHAFQHYALRARRPTVWIPRDDIGVSDDEVKRTREFAGANIWISNVGAALDGKSNVVYGRNPPDFSEVDLINL